MSLDARVIVLSQMYGTAGASAMIILSIAAHALLRSAPAGIVDAFVMAALIFGSSSCGQLVLPCARMFFPLNVADNIDSGSEKSLNHPTFGQIGGCTLGTP